MKINEAEKLLGIKKANIRFYEKEGLITPERSENGYRNYSDIHIAKLKQIIILRKLGIPVQQIADILNGRLSLQDALDRNIDSLQETIEKLSGSLALCRQLKSEDSRILDTERYWKLIQDQEQQGFLFHTLKNDYISFVNNHIRSFWFIPESRKSSTKKVIQYTLLSCIAFAAVDETLGFHFWNRLGFRLYLKFIFPFLLGLCMIPAFIIGRKNERYGELLKIVIKCILASLLLYFGMKQIFA